MWSQTVRSANTSSGAWQGLEGVRWSWSNYLNYHGVVDRIDALNRMSRYFQHELGEVAPYVEGVQSKANLG